MAKKILKDSGNWLTGGIRTGSVPTFTDGTAADSVWYVSGYSAGGTFPTPLASAAFIDLGTMQYRVKLSMTIPGPGIGWAYGITMGMLESWGGLEYGTGLYVEPNVWDPIPTDGPRLALTVGRSVAYLAQDRLPSSGTASELVSGITGAPWTVSWPTDDTPLEYVLIEHVSPEVQQAAQSVWDITWELVVDGPGDRASWRRTAMSDGGQVWTDWIDGTIAEWPEQVTYRPSWLSLSASFDGAWKSYELDPWQNVISNDNRWSYSLEVWDLTDVRPPQRMRQRGDLWTPGGAVSIRKQQRTVQGGIRRRGLL